MGESDRSKLSFPAFIRAWRELNRLSLSEAATLIGCAKPHLWELEQGRTRNPGIAILAGMSRAYGVSVADLATRAAVALSPSGER